MATLTHDEGHDFVEGEIVVPAATFPACVRAGKSRSKATGKRDCHLHDRLQWVDVATCQACPLAGLLPNDAREAEAKLWAAKPKWPRKKSPTVGRGQVDLTCVHRGLEVRTELCQTCGEKTVYEPIYACDVHGECALRRYKAGQKPKSCLSCDDRASLVKTRKTIQHEKRTST